MCKGNQDYLDAINHAAFAICLENASPNNASERARQFHFGDGSNRWNDKSTQFLICSNGVSGLVGDHTMLDANSVVPLNCEIVRAIAEHAVEGLDRAAENRTSPIVLHELKLTVPTSLHMEIKRVREDFRINTAGWKHVFWNYEGFGSGLMRHHKVAPNSAFQVIVQLAGCRFYGRQNYCCMFLLSHISSFPVLISIPSLALFKYKY